MNKRMTATTTLTTKTTTTTTTTTKKTKTTTTTRTTTTTMESTQSYRELCRLCASYDSLMIDIFGPEGKSRQFIEKIEACLPFKIRENDNLPKNVCNRCIFNLENFYDFRIACVNAVALLERQLPTSKALNGDINNHAHCSNVQFQKEQENIPIIISEAPIVNPNAALGTPPRLNYSAEVDQAIEEYLENGATDEEATIDSDDRKSDEFEFDMETNPSDFLEMPPMVTEDNEETNSKNISTAMHNSTVFQHTLEQHEVYVCPLCGKAFSSKGHLSLHARIHTGAGNVIGQKVITDDHTSYKRPYQCDLCNKSYSTAKHRWGHVSTTHRGHPAVTCGYCSRIYSTRINLEEHVKSNHAGVMKTTKLLNPLYRSKSKYYCKACSKLFTSLSDLNIHSQLCMRHSIEVQSGIRRGISSVKELMVDTSDVSSLDTDDENKGFKNAEAKLVKNSQLTILKQALIKGSGIKRNADNEEVSPHKIMKMEDCQIPNWYCDVCSKGFTSVEDLKKHETTHETDKPFICILCREEFALKSLLSNHILALHGVDPTPLVDNNLCLKQIVLTKPWGQQIPIPISDQKDVKEPLEFASSPEINLENEDEDLNRGVPDNWLDMETVFVCEICTRDFNDRASLWLHMRALHKESAAFACGVCLKICSDNIQLLNHVTRFHGGSKLLVSEQRRYSCTICGRQHDSRKKLIAHVSIHNISSQYDPASFVQLNSNYYSETINGNETNENILEYDGDEGEKIDCYTCYKSFPNEDHLIRHLRNAHKNEQMADVLGNGNPGNMNGTSNKAQYHLFFICEFCGKSYSSKWERWLHVSSEHRDEPSIKCEQESCGKIFSTKTLRNDHINHHIMQGPLPNTCEICGKLWTGRVDYWKHVMGVHSATVPLICGVCLKIFPNVLLLKTHVRTLHWPLTNADFSCDICGRPYSNKSKMLKHRRIHGLEIDGYDNNSINDNLNESSKYEHSIPQETIDLTCEACAEMKFPNLESLSDHRRSVHGLFPCDLCNKFYGRTSHLWKHVNRVHKGHVDVTCPYCLKTSASRDHLAGHIAKIHRFELEVKKDNKNSENLKSSNGEEGVLYYCEKCNKGFHKRYLLRRHMKACQNYRKDPGALLTRCRACERIFKDRASLQKHIENHHSQYTCHLCKETVTSKLGIMTHNRINHMNHPDLTCLDCKKLFRTKEDLESHQNDHRYHSSPNVCDYCGDTVENKLKLKMHVLSLHRNEIGVSCGVCLIPMKDPKDLKKHVEDEHKSVLSRPNTCHVCGKQYASKWKAFDHTNKCHGKVFTPCKHCLAVFTTDEDIKDHYERVHNISKNHVALLENRMDVPVDIIVKEEPEDIDSDEEICDDDLNNSKGRRSLTDTFDCEMCPEIFLNYETLAKHYENVHNTDPANMFTKKSNDGKRKVKNRKNFECTYCKKQFPTYSLFWNHINVCGRDGEFNAQTIAPTSILETHLKNNNQIKKEEASSFTNQTNLIIPDFKLFENINLQLSAQKPVPKLMPLSHAKPPATKCSRKDSRKVYDESTNTECTCEVCGKPWPAKKHLWQHLIRFHKPQAAVTCGVCLKLCQSYQDLSDHLKATHDSILSSDGNNFTCKTCGRYHNARSKLFLHMGVHIDDVGKYWCQKCQESFELESKFSEHIQTCKKKIQSRRSNSEDNIKNENEEKGSLIGDETSVVGEVDEVEEYSDSDLEEEDGATQEYTNSENSEHFGSSNSGSNNMSNGEEEAEGENDFEARSRSNNRTITIKSYDIHSENVGAIQNQNLNDTNRFVMHNEDTEKNNLKIRLLSPDTIRNCNDIHKRGEQQDLNLTESLNGAKLNNFHIKKEEGGRNQMNLIDEDDDGPPVLSPIMPLLEQESAQHNNPINDMKHKLSPMVVMNDVKTLEMCELPENCNDEGDDMSPINYYENPDSKISVEYGCEGFENMDNDEEDTMSTNDDGQMEIDEQMEMDEQNVNCNNENGYEKLDISINDSEMDCYEDNLDEEEMKYDETRDTNVQIHDLDGAVLMVTNDSEGNQILIQPSVLTIGNEDCNAGTTAFIYEEANEYEMEDYGIVQQEGSSDDIHNISFIQEESDNEEEDDSMEGIEITDTKEHNLSAKSEQFNV